MTDPLAAAHDYVRRGWGVVPLYGVTEDGCRCRAGRTCPLKNRGKHPHGSKKGWRIFTNGADVQAWWEEHPTDNLGVVTGPDSGLFVFDVDGAAGVKSVTDMAAEHGALPPTRIIRTGSGGLHYYFRHPGHFTVHDSAGYLGPGIDIRGAGGQVVAPPSASSLGTYEVIADHAIAEAPAWLLALLAEHAAHIAAGRRVDVVSAERVDVEFMPPAVETLRSTLVGEDMGRHKHFHALVAACFENGYTQGQTVTIAAPWCAAVGKFIGRVEQEVARSWAKLLAEAARSEEWLPGSTTLSGPATPLPDTTPAPTTQPAPDQPLSAPAMPSAPTDADPDSDDPATDDLPPTWAPVDLTAILSGSYVPELPTLMTRSDGIPLIYPGRVHSFHGESESGKSLVAQALVTDVIGAGGTAAYLDFESDAGAVVGRLLELGASHGDLLSGFEYRRPDTDPRRFAHERLEFGLMAAREWTIIIIDGMTDALGVWGAGTMDNDEIAGFMRTFPRLLARRTGAAVIIVDHVTKDADSRGRFAVGGQAKMNALDGAAYTVEIVEPLGRGLCGSIELRVAKDRPGGVREHCGSFRKDRTQEAARVVIDSRTEAGTIRVSVEPPRSRLGDEGEGSRPFRPTALMERASRLLEAGTVATLSGRELKPLMGKGANEVKGQAIAMLVHEGFITESPHASIRPYRAHDDAQSDSYVGWAEQAGDPPIRSDPEAIRGSVQTGDPSAPLPEGGADRLERSETGGAIRSDPESAEMDGSCRKCWKPTPVSVLSLYGERCASCARDAGMTVGQ